MKKIIAMLLALVMVMGLVACGQAPAEPAATEAPKADAPAATEAPAAPEKITLKVWGPSEDQTPQEGQTQRWDQ